MALNSKAGTHFEFIEEDAKSSAVEVSIIVLTVSIHERQLWHL
jgi:hypothetical protein